MCLFERKRLMGIVNEIFEFTVTENTTNYVLLSTNIPLYFFRATNNEKDLDYLDYHYHLILKDGGEIDITTMKIDIHPAVLAFPDIDQKYIFLRVGNGGIVSVHPSDLVSTDTWLYDQLKKSGVTLSELDWAAIGWKPPVETKSEGFAGMTSTSTTTIRKED